MRTKFIFFILLSLILFISCGKKEDSESQRKIDSLQESNKRILDSLNPDNNKPAENSNQTGQTNQNLTNSNVSVKKIVNDAKKKFKTYLPRIEKDHNGKLDLMNVYTGDFTGDGKEDVVIWFTLSPSDGGNAIVWAGLVFYQNMGDEAKVIAGYEPNYGFYFNRISEGKIFITKTEYRDNDARCCPSIHIPKELTVINSKVYERDIGIDEK